MVPLSNIHLRNLDQRLCGRFLLARCWNANQPEKLWLFRDFFWYQNKGLYVCVYLLPDGLAQLLYIPLKIGDFEIKTSGNLRILGISKSTSKGPAMPKTHMISHGIHTPDVLVLLSLPEKSVSVFVTSIFQIGRSLFLQLLSFFIGPKFQHVVFVYLIFP